jgi:putative transposase
LAAYKRLTGSGAGWNSSSRVVRAPRSRAACEEIRRRTYVVRIFPNAESCLRLVRALTVERHEAWLEDHRYLNMDLLKEHKKEMLRAAA